MLASDSRIGTSFGKYKLTALLGSGGMGEVYAADDGDKGRTVALKILRDQYAQDERFRTRFLRESRAAAILQEPHVVPIHDWGEIDGSLYIDMRLVPGQTLHDLLRTGPLEPHRAVLIVEQIAAALDAAHAGGLIHRDVKPQNIIVTSADFAYLLDFGIAQAQGDTSLTQAGMQVGSLGYMAPERFGDEPCSPASDIYSLACVLYEALTGDTPFPTHSYEQVIAAHLSAPPPRPSKGDTPVPVAMDEVIARGMAKEPDDRYGSAGAFGRAAQRALTTSEEARAAAANTMAAPYVSPAYRNAAPQDYFAGSTAPMDSQGTDTRGRQSAVPLTVVGIVAALLLGAVGVMIGLLVSKNSVPTSDSTPVGATTVAAPSPPSVTVAGPTVYKTVPAPPAQPSTPNYTTTARDPEPTSVQQLRQIVNADRPVLISEAEGRWVPQLSSKRPGVVDEGVAWDDTRTLQEHLRLRQQYGAKLLWSGDWSTFDAPNFWVTIAPIAYDNAGGALAWCAAEGFDRDHCYAKLISTTHAVPGTTAFN
ncbi:serine/threonine-protein kinase [Mycobacterium sp. NPDC003449]